jgi:high-affinity nickel-transport protein
VRRLYYNMVITALSIAVAFLIGGIEIASLLTAELHLHGWLGSVLGSVDLNTAGYLVVGMFIAVWAVAVSVWHLARLERRWRPASGEEAR